MLCRRKEPVIQRIVYIFSMPGNPSPRRLPLAWSVLIIKPQRPVLMYLANSVDPDQRAPEGAH